MNLRDQQLYDALHVNGPESASALARRLDVSTPTVTRALAKLGYAIVTIGKGRASTYALRRDVSYAGNAWPLYAIDAEGRPVLLGELQALHGRYPWYLVPAHPLPLFMRGEFANGLYGDLPWFLQALRPQGYLGRIIVAALARGRDAPKDIALWRSEDVLRSLINFVQDLPGNLAVYNIGDTQWRMGEKSAYSKLNFLPNFSERAQKFKELVSQAEFDPDSGSSAAGERPKFTTTLVHSDERLQAVIVKFAPLVEGNPTAQRWADLLICEEIASRTLHAHGIDTARTEILDADDWRFLQSTRFDRTPQGGRIGVFALDAMDMAYVGSDQRDWLAGAEPLHAEGLIDSSDLDRIRLLNAFGRCIGNNDMHHGNLSFFAEPERAALRLAPVYDMLPMHYRPAVSGLVRETPFELPAPDLHHLTIWTQAATLAAEFWTTAANDKRLSKLFARVCLDNYIRIVEWKALHRM